MRILNIEPDPGATGVAARFDIELNAYIRLYGLTLRHHPSGYRTVAPNLRGRHSATFHPELAERITSVAVAALNRRPKADDTARAAA